MAGLSCERAKWDDRLSQQLTVCDWISDIISKARAKRGWDY